MIVGQRSTPAPPIAVWERDSRVYRPTALSWGITRMAAARQACKSPSCAVETPNQRCRLMPFRGGILSAWEKWGTWGTTTRDAPHSPLSPFSPSLAYAPFSRLCIGWTFLLYRSCEDDRGAPVCCQSCSVLSVSRLLAHIKGAMKSRPEHKLRPRDAPSDECMARAARGIISASDIAEGAPSWGRSVRWQLTCAAAVYNVVRMRTLAAAV
jgi:hypothetical protein